MHICIYVEKFNRSIVYGSFCRIVCFKGCNVTHKHTQIEVCFKLKPHKHSLKFSAYLVQFYKNTLASKLNFDPNRLFRQQASGFHHLYRSL